MSSNEKDEDKKSLSTLEIVGIVAGVTIFVGVVAYFLFFHKKKDPYVEQLLGESRDFQSRIVPLTPHRVNPYYLPNVSPIKSYGFRNIFQSR